jgi:hypothetical protein
VNQWHLWNTPEVRAERQSQAEWAMRRAMELPALPPWMFERLAPSHPPLSKRRKRKTAA